MIWHAMLCNEYENIWYFFTINRPNVYRDVFSYLAMGFPCFFVAKITDFHSQSIYPHRLFTGGKRIMFTSTSDMRVVNGSRSPPQSIYRRYLHSFTSKCETFTPIFLCEYVSQYDHNLVRLKLKHVRWTYSIISQALKECHRK